MRFGNGLAPVVAALALVGAAVGLVIVLKGTPTALPNAAAAGSALQEEQMTWDDVHQLAVALDAAAFGRVCSDGWPVFLAGEVMTVTEVEKSDGSRVPAGRILDHPEIQSGVVITREVLDVWVDEVLWTEARHGEMVVAGTDVAEYDEMCIVAPNCCVGCNDGYYACGWRNPSPPPPAYCRCIQDGGQEPSGGCPAGGPGSNSCSI